MRLTKEALIKKTCGNVEIIEYQVVDVLSDQSLQELISANPDKVIYSIVKSNQVSNKLFLTSHQFTNIVGTDIYIYIGNGQGQSAYQLLLEDMSKVRRLDEKLVTFLRTESTTTLSEIDLKTDSIEKIPQKLTDFVAQIPNNLIYVLLTESLINKGIAEILFDSGFKEIGDSHLFIYAENAYGSHMIDRINHEALTNIE